MQLIAEAYYILKHGLGLEERKIHEVFASWNEGELNSYLIEITRDILGKVDKETGRPMVELILDTAGQKGTGKWTSQVALDLGVSAPTITEAVYARFISAIKDQRVEASKVLKGPEGKVKANKEDFIEAVRQALLPQRYAPMPRVLP